MLLQYLLVQENGRLPMAQEYLQILMIRNLPLPVWEMELILSPGQSPVAVGH